VQKGFLERTDVLVYGALWDGRGLYLMSSFLKGGILVMGNEAMGVSAAG